ncbi:Fe2+-dependent dioxygenase [Zavarzinia compransoris]|uniref:Fe2+-dependent dioxygenase n=1 Tax=Zavarzinia compransoris TaxID=1264899 RepID=A0A317E5E1_9PROT|nr:Fe2+-dependent dioxygenase [Zavarzinia compransoris]PWR21901.1 Fe2+-dependent dioxygenase [Zavarzinia compransoris]TDP47369.1 PKHD-type hydroxylase [Zavarzinia compransoris]
MLIAIDKVLTVDEVAGFRRDLAAAAWQDGALTSGTLARHRKRNQQLDEADPLARRLGHHILRLLGHHPLFVSAALPARIYPPKFNRYADEGTYGAHVDSAIMRVPGTDVVVRSDLSATLFLSDPDSYDGGELEIEGQFGVQAVKLEAGDMILYPSTSLHRVTPVTRGERLAAFFWIESLVADEGQRGLLFDLDQAIQGLTSKAGPEDGHLLALTGVYHNLLRRWAIT